MNNKYLIPANTKRGQLIFSIFRPVDLGIWITGMVTTFVIFVAGGSTISSNIFMAILALLPGLVCTGLVIPLANYHNFLVSYFSFYFHKS